MSLIKPLDSSRDQDCQLLNRGDLVVELFVLEMFIDLMAQSVWNLVLQPRPVMDGNDVRSEKGTPSQTMRIMEKNNIDLAIVV